MDKSRPGDIMALGRDVHRLEYAMDMFIALGLTKSCLSSSCKSSDLVLKGDETANIGKDNMSYNPISSSSTMRFIPLALNHPGLRGPHIQVTLKEFATIPRTKPEGYSLLRNPFVLTHSGAMHMILTSWGTMLTWSAQREHASQIVTGM